MSELKARHIVDVYYSYYAENPFGERSQVYLKSEADKVIAELKDKALQYKVLDKEHCRDLNTQERFFAKQIAHNKYKRCLAMAKWCHNQREIYERDSYNWELEDDAVNSLRNKANIMRKWRKRWLKLAEKFKEAK
jgi:hypothetical protein